VETIGSKRSYALIWCMPNNDDDDELLSSPVCHTPFDNRNRRAVFRPSYSSELILYICNKVQH